MTVMVRPGGGGGGGGGVVGHEGKTPPSGDPVSDVGEHPVHYKL